MRLLEAIRATGLRPKFYQASSSELFGKVHEVPQSEKTPFHLRSPYSLCQGLRLLHHRKLSGVVRHVCRKWDLCSITSERRGETFVSRKITRAATRIKLGLQQKLYLGNLDAQRDWGYAKDYVAAMWLMLQAEVADDYVIATGETHSVREFLDETFACLELDWQEFVETDPRYFRPAEVDLLLGDAGKARRELGWEPKVSFKELVRLMVDHDLELAKQESAAQQARGLEPATKAGWGTICSANVLTNFICHFTQADFIHLAATN